MNIHKVVTFRASSIGDALMGKYFLENVHAAYPEARCYMLVGSRGAMIRDLLRGYPWLTVIEANRRNPGSLWRAWAILRGSDVALTQYSENPFSLPSKLFAWLVSKRLIGFEDSWRGNRFLYDAILPWRGEAKSNGMILEEQKALAAAGVPVHVSELALAHISNSAMLSRRGLDNKTYVVVHLFSGSEGRSVSQVKRVEIVRTLHEMTSHVPSHVLVLTGGKGDAARAEEAARGLAGVVNLAGKTSMQELINLIMNARGVLALDTGAAHIAAHLKRPLVVLTRKEARTAWWGNTMYQNLPTVLCNEVADDLAPRSEPYPPSMETIDSKKIADIVSKSCEL